MEAVVEKTLWNSRVSTTEMYWVGIGLGIALNAILFGIILKLIATTNDKRRMNRLRE